MTAYSPLPPPEAPVACGPVELWPGARGGRYPYCHSLVITGEETWVVDPASDRARLAALAATGRVTRVFFSHYHEDHLKYAYLFPEAAWYVPALEAEAFRSLQGVFALAGVEDPVFREYLRETLSREFHFTPRPAVHTYAPGDRFANGRVVLEVMAAPGHTPGHSCFAFPAQDLLFLADVDLTLFGPWYGDATSSLEDYLHTLSVLQDTRAGRYLTAHEQGVFTGRQAREGLAYFREVIEARDETILELLRRPRSLEELVAAHPIYRRPREPQFVYDHMEGHMLRQHLKRLVQQEIVLQEGAVYIRNAG